MSPEEKAAWLAERAGKLTASRMNDAMDYLKDGRSGSRRVKLLHELLAERLTGDSMPHVVTDAMMHGLEFEDEAVDTFVMRFPQYRVHRSRFYEHPTIANFGATPDREIDHDGLIEVKCPTTPTFVNWILAGEVPAQHKNQMCAQMLCTGRAWVGFLAYDPRIRDERKRLWMRKYVPTDDELRRVEDAAVAFLDELDSLFDVFVTQAA